MANKQGYKKIYNYLVIKYKEEKPFSIAGISEFTGLKESSMGVYFRNKLNNIYTEKTKDGIKVKSEILTKTEKEFIDYLCQKALPNNESDLAENLFMNSKSALLSAIEIHNKPIFRYRYQIVTILIINAWELLLKAYILKNMKDVKIILNNGKTKPFDECVKCVFGTLGKNYFVYEKNLLLLYDYRCKFIHFYTEDLDILLFSLLQKNVLLYTRFISEFFSYDISKSENFYILPIGFSKPFSPIDYITNNSSIKDVSKEVKEFVCEILDKTKELASENIDETIFIPYSIHYKNESRLGNADIIAAINNNKDVKISISEDINITDNPNAKKVTLKEESIFKDTFTETYADVCEYCKDNFPKFKRNAEFNTLMADIKNNPNLHKKRFLNIKTSQGTSKPFYSKDVYNKLKEFYDAKS